MHQTAGEGYILQLDWETGNWSARWDISLFSAACSTKFRVGRAGAGAGVGAR